MLEGTNVDQILDTVKDDLNPRIVCGALKTAKRFTKGQIADYVECRIVEPANHVNLLSSVGAVLLKRFHEFINVVTDDGFLIQHGLMRKAICQGPSVASVIGAVGTNNIFNV